MKIFYTQLNQSNRNCTEGFFRHTMYEYFLQTHSFVETLDEADAVLFFYCYYHQYEFDTELADKIKSSGKPVIIFDYLECGAPSLNQEDHLFKMQILGYRYDLLPYNPLTPEYAKMVDFFYTIGPQIKVYFKREMPSQLDYSGAPFRVLPCEYPINFEPYTPQSSDNYYNRPHDLYFNYGLSNVDRFRLHGKFLMEADRIGHNIIQTEKAEENFAAANRVRNIVLWHREWYERVNFKDRNALSRTTMDLYGAGMKCFRSTEGTINSLAFKEDPSLLRYSYPWVNGVNCITLPVDKNNRLKVDEAFEIIHYYLRGEGQSKLYELYLKSVETNHLYRTPSYMANYVIPNILI